MATPSRRLVGAVLAVGLALFGASTAWSLPEEDPLCVTAAPDGPPSPAWYSGDSASYLYDANFTSGANLPDGMLPGGDVDERYVPQGLAVWHDWRGGTSTEDLFLISAYRDSTSPWVGTGSGSDAFDGRSAIFAVVAGSSTARGRALIASGHVGGIAVVGDWVYVGTEHTIRAYRAADLREFIDGPNVDSTLADVPSRRLTIGTTYLDEVSFLGEGNGVVWAGEFTDPEGGRMYKVVQAADGSLSLPPASVFTPTPRKVQGVAVTSQQFIYSTSFGRGNRSNLWVVDRNATEATGANGAVTDGNSFCVRAPSMSEGISIWDDASPKRLVSVFESSAFKYRNGDGNGYSRNPIPELHRIDVPNLLDLLTIYRTSD